MSAVIVMFLVEGKSTDLGGFLDEQKSSAECKIKKTNFIQACDCSGNFGSPTSRSNEIEGSAQSLGCGWATGNAFSCNDACNSGGSSGSGEQTSESNEDSESNSGDTSNSGSDDTSDLGDDMMG